MQSHLSTVLHNRSLAEQAALKPFVKQLGMVDMMLQGNPKDANALKQKQALELQMEAARDAATKDFDILKSQIEARMFGGKGPICALGNPPKPCCTGGRGAAGIGGRGPACGGAIGAEGGTAACGPAFIVA